MTIAFAGHSVIPDINGVKAVVKDIIKEYIVESESITIFIGGYGGFDKACADVCKALKEEYDNIEVVYVTPYLTISEQEKIKQMQYLRLCDSSIYPPIENTPPRFAISKRNEWMMTNADLVIAYVNHDYGGAYASLKVARRKKKKIINICDIICSR